MESVDQRRPTDALDDVAYLTRSPNRLRILDALTDGPATRRELTDATGASRTTLDRIVNEFEERAWAQRRADGRYAATPTGSALFDAVAPVLDAVAAIQRLGDAVGWLPRDEHPIGLEHFGDASVRRPENRDPVETGDYFAELVAEADEISVLTEWAPPERLAKTLHDQVVDGHVEGTFVVTADTIGYVFEDPSRRNRWEEMLDANATSWLYDGDVPCNCFVLGDTVLVKSSGPDAVHESYGSPIESTNPVVREWALDMIERYREESTRVDPDALAG